MRNYRPFLALGQQNLGPEPAVTAVRQCNLGGNHEKSVVQKASRAGAWLGYLAGSLQAKECSNYDFKPLWKEI
jgi:hypothetical protein